MTDRDGDRERLLGVLATRTGLATRDDLSAAWKDRGAPGAKSLGRALVDRGTITAAELALLETLSERHRMRHGGDPRQSLATLRRPETTEPPAAFDETEPSPPEDPVPTLAVGDPTEPGQRFRLLRPHARGGLGEVWVAHDEELHREVALKELQERFVDDVQNRARFLQEAEITGALEHPGVVPIYGRGQYADGRPFYAMRLIKGESLKAALNRLHRAPKEARREPGAWNWEFRRLVRRVLDVCNVIDYAHSRGVLHRDLKPDNIMLGEYGEALVVDWGLAKRLGQPDVIAAVATTVGMSSPHGSSDDLDPTMIGRALGTWSYMSPEQAAGRVDLLGPASDVYSLGATLYHVLTGQAPYRGVPRPALAQMIQAGGFMPPHEVNPDVPPALEAICVKAMSPAAADRHPSARALAGDLEQWLGDEPIAAYRVAVAHHERRVRENPGRENDVLALARIHSNLGNALHFLGRNAEAEAAHRTALAEFRSLVERRPDNRESRERLAVAYSNLAWVLRALGRKDEADAAYNDSLTEYKAMTSTSLLGRTSSNDPGLTALFVSQGWPSESDSTTGDPAAEDAPRAIETHPSLSPTGISAEPAQEPDDFATYFQRGKAFHKEGDRDRAIADYTAAIRIDPTFAEVYNRRGNAYLDKGETALAIADYSRAIRLDPADPVLYYNRGKAHETGGDHADAIVDYTEAIRLDPQFTKAHLRRSKAYNALGR